MKSNNLLYLAVVGILLLFSSCAEQRNLVYFDDIQQSDAYQQAITNAHEPKIQVGDIMGITVSTLDPTSNALFNTGAVIQGSNPQLSTTQAAGSTNLGKEGYLVGNDGTINFPVIGKVNLQGLTLTQAHEKMRNEISEYVKDPIVNVRYMNFKVTVIGEVARPTTFTVDNEKINVLEALGRAGDMTSFGMRENVLVIREVDGKRNMARLNLNSSNAFQSPYFYLQQNDIVYVEPSDMKGRQANRNPNSVPIIMGILSIITIIATRL
ncbi:polysaccharide biosynthesis/export family protein [Albibacterium indicum]|uniref:polysaccharide biosynthesis/export family protein n=1 Tax=Albibacterium indicum TaxID=2292082 RepID=UPI000E476001|nr:polysaccharide biosynthesis/export family protein [Pedobacter indicus]